MCPLLFLALLSSVSSFSFSTFATRREAREWHRDRWERNQKYIRQKHGKNFGVEQERADSTDSDERADELHTRQQHAHYAAHGLPLKKYGLPATKSQWEKQLVKDGKNPNAYSWERTHYWDTQRVHFLEQEREKRLRHKLWGIGDYSETAKSSRGGEKLQKQNTCRGCGGRTDAGGFLSAGASGACSRSCAERCLYCSLNCPAYCWRAKTKRGLSLCCEDMGVSTCKQLAGTIRLIGRLMGWLIGMR